MSNWISVNDRLPDPGERVIATDGVFAGEGFIDFKGGSWFRHNGCDWGMLGRYVTHWMPMPKPPEENTK